jgi:RNA polymerase sigma-B factor
MLYLRFYEDRTQREIAVEFGISQYHVSRLLSRILSDLRSRLTSPGDLPAERGNEPDSDDTQAA